MTSLAGGTPRVETPPLLAARAAGERALLAVPRQREPVHVPDGLGAGERIAAADLTGSAVLDLLSRTLAELAGLAGAAARGEQGVSSEGASSVSGECAEPLAGHDNPSDAGRAVLVLDVGESADHQPRWPTTLTDDAFLRSQIAAHGGTEVEANGSSLAAAFSSARSALLCAIALQRTVAGRAAERPAEPLRMRLGVHAEGESNDDAARVDGVRSLRDSHRLAGAEGRVPSSPRR